MAGVAVAVRSLERADLGALAALLGRTRAAGGISHPGGIQWWLRLLGRERFEAHVWDARGELVAFVMADDTFVVAETGPGGPSRLELVSWAEDRLRDAGREAIEVSTLDDEVRAALAAAGYAPSGTGEELMLDLTGARRSPVLPPGYTLASLADVSDEAYVEMHRAAWSDRRPSPYRRELHDAVRAMPQFRPDLVTIVRAPDGTPAAYCIGWLDPLSATLEIEPLGTHRAFRRLGLARAVVAETARRAAASGARSMLVWGATHANAAAFALYTCAGMRPRRHLVDLRKELAGA